MKVEGNRKGDKKKNSKGGLIFAGILILLSIMDEAGGDAAGVIGVLICIAVFFGICAIIGKAAKQKGNKSTSSAVNYERKSAKQKDESIPYAPSQPEKKSYEPEKKYYDSDCERASSQHDHDRRMEQLDGFLKDGIISRKEYEILKSKYMR